MLIILILLSSCYHIGLGFLPPACDKALISELTYRINGNNLEWPCQSTKNIYLSTERFIPQNIIGTRAQIYVNDLIVALPRYRSGVPFTLGRINMRSAKSCQAKVQPFPCWSMQEEGNCQALQSVVDIYLDNHDTLWALDVGYVNTLEQPIKRCPAKIVAINVRSGKVVKIIDLSNLVSAESRLQYLLVDYDDAGQIFVYISDAGSRAILVHNSNANKSHRIVLPEQVTIDSAKHDVLYMVPVKKSDGTHHIYFTYLGSSRLFALKRDQLRNGLIREGGDGGGGGGDGTEDGGTVVDIGVKPNNLPIVLLGSDKNILFIRYKGQSDIFAWNIDTSFKDSNFLQVQKGSECRLPTQVFPGVRSFMWTIESNFHNYITDTVGCNGPSVLIHPIVHEVDF